MARIISIDAMKGYGILAIILIHTAHIPIEYHNYISAVCIPFFFVISGFTIKDEYGSKAIAKKSHRLLIPYFFWGVLLTLLHLLTSHSNNYIGEFLGLLYSRFQLYAADRPDNIYMLPVKTTSPLWFVTCMYMAMLLYMVYCMFKKRWQRIACIAAYALISFAFQFSPILLPWNFDTSFLACLFIISGKALRNHKSSLPAVIILLFIYIAIVHLNGPTNLSLRRYGMHWPFSIVPFYIIGTIYPLIVRYFMEKYECSSVVKALAHIGKLSLRIMIIHLPIYTFLTMMIASNIACTALTIVTSILASYAVEMQIVRKSKSSFWAYI